MPSIFVSRAYSNKKKELPGWGWLAFVWLPVLLGVLVIAIESTATFSAANTSSWLRPIAEAVFAGLLAAGALYTVFNEGPNNWQSLWTCAIYFLLAITLWRARAVQIPK